MTIHQKHLTTSARALIAAGEHLRQKDGGDAMDIIAKNFTDHADATTKRFAALDKRTDDLERKANRAALFGDGNAATETWGRKFVRQDGLKSFAADHSRPGRFRMEMKSTITNAADSGGSLGTPQRDATVLLPQRQLMVRDLLNVLSVSSNAVEYVTQTARTSAAGTVAETQLKPESALAYALRTVNTQVIAHWIPASRQVLEDAPQLSDLIDSDLRYGLQFEEENQILNGDGTGANLLGLIPQATDFVAPITIATPNNIDTIGLAILQSALVDFPADGIMMHPSDWTHMRLIKDGDGKYLLGDPQSAIAPRLFGLPVVATKAMAPGTFLVGNFAAAATIYDRWETRVMVSTEHADFFTRNMVAILAEERIGLAVKQPLALTHGEFTDQVG